MYLVTTDEQTTVNRARELAQRENDGVTVILSWHPRTNTVTLSVDDSRTGEYFELDIERENALDAFYHPFAYIRLPVDLPAAA